MINSKLIRHALAVCCFIALLLSGSCSKPKTIPGTFRAPISPEADPIVARLEAGCNTDYDSAMYHRLTDSLDLLSRGNKLPPPRLKSAVAYWKAYIASMERQDSLLQVYADSCVALTDSAKYPYEYARARMLQIENVDSNLVNIFKANASSIKIFKNVGDSLNAAKAYNMLGIRLAILTNTSESIKYLKESRKYSQPGSKMRFRSDFNLFMTYSEAIKKNLKLPGNPMEELYAMADSLMANPLYATRPKKIKASILRSKYQQTGDVNWLYKIDTVGLDPKTHWLRASKEAWITEHFTKQGNIDSAAVHFNKLPRHFSGNFTYKEDILEAVRDYYKMTGNTDSAAFYEEEFNLHQQMTFQQTQDLMEITESLSDDELASIEQEFKTKEQDTRIWAWIGNIGILLLCGAGTWYVVRLLRRRHSTDTKKLTQELNEAKRRQMVTEVKSSDVSKTSASDWEKVESLFVETNPKFIEELYRRNPGLTPGDVRMACFTLMGMETKHIARLLSINPASVAKNRYRLRQKLGLGPDQTLDAFLHSLASTLHD